MIACSAGRGSGPTLLRTSLPSMGKPETQSKHRIEFVPSLLTRHRQSRHGVRSQRHVAMSDLGQQRRAATVGAKELKTIPVAMPVRRHRDFWRIILAR